MAIFKTSDLDRKARIFENKYKVYQKKLLELSDLKYIYFVNDFFFGEPILDFINYEKIIKNIQKLNDYKLKINQTSYFIPNDKYIFDEFEKTLNIFIEIYELSSEKTLYCLQIKDKSVIPFIKCVDNKFYADIKELLQIFKQQHNYSELKNQKEKIDKFNNYIISQFNLDLKK